MIFTGEILLFTVRGEKIWFLIVFPCSRKWKFRLKFEEEIILYIQMSNFHFGWHGENMTIWKRGKLSNIIGFLITNYAVTRLVTSFKTCLTRITISLNYRHTHEPRHEKTCFCHMRTTKAQISLRIRAVWSAPIPSYIHHSDGNCRKLPVSVKRCELTYLFNNLHWGNRGKY